MDRHTVAATGDFAESVDDEYLENNCVDDPVKLCDFQLLENRIMKTVDSVYQVIALKEIYLVCKGKKWKSLPEATIVISKMHDSEKVSR